MQVQSRLPEIIEQDTEVVSKLRDFMEPETSWYQAWFVRMRLAEELHRSSKYKHSFSVVLLSLNSPPGASAEDMAYFNALLWEVADVVLRTPDVPGEISRNEYVILLPETTRAQAAEIGEDIAVKLKQYGPALKIAEYPRDATTLEELWSFLRNPRPPNVISIDEYRQRRPLTDQIRPISP